MAEEEIAPRLAVFAQIDFSDEDPDAKEASPEIKVEHDVADDTVGSTDASFERQPSPQSISSTFDFNEFSTKASDCLWAISSDLALDSE